MTDTTVDAPAVATDPMLSVEDLHVSFGRGNATVQAVAGISFSLQPGRDARARRRVRLRQVDDRARHRPGREGDLGQNHASATPN